MRSPLYWHPQIYSTALRLLYGRHFTSRYADIARFIPAKSRVLDVCMGDGRLYTDFLKYKNVDYTGLDVNGIFIRYARNHGVNAQRFDLNRDTLPVCDYTVMQGSLYQFIPHEREILAKLLAATRHTLIISEPVKNLSSSRIPLIAWLARQASTTQAGRAEQRFHAASLHSLFAGFSEFNKLLPVAGERELAGIFTTAV